MKTQSEQDIGCAIAPWWMTREYAFEVMTHNASYRIEKVVHDEDFSESIERHGIQFYRIRFIGKSDEWVTRRDYCLRALSMLCDSLCRVLHLRFRGNWFIIAEGQHGQHNVTAKGDDLEAVITEVLAQLDPLWKR